MRPSGRRAIGWRGFQWVQLVESFGLHPFVDFFAVYRYVGGRSEAEADLTALNAEDSHRHLVAYIYGLTWTPAENQHRCPRLTARAGLESPTPLRLCRNPIRPYN